MFTTSSGDELYKNVACSEVRNDLNLQSISVTKLNQIPLCINNRVYYVAIENMCRRN